MVQPWRRSATTSMYSSWVNMTGGALQCSGTCASPEAGGFPHRARWMVPGRAGLRSIAKFGDHLSRISVIADSERIGTGAGQRHHHLAAQLDGERGEAHRQVP